MIRCFVSSEQLRLLLTFLIEEYDMYIEATPEYCSKCNSKNVEYFHRAGQFKGYRGKRCLNCGHEVITPPPKENRESWKKSISDKKTF